MKIVPGIPYVIGLLAALLQIGESKVYEDWGMPSVSVAYVYGGQNVTKRGVYPWHLAILHSGRYKGGGSLISQKFALTVSHVTYDASGNEINPKSMTIKAGVIKLTDTDANTYTVAEILRYPGFNQINYLNDICLLKLAGLVTFGQNVRPIYLWDNNDKVLSELNDKKQGGKVIGFGLTESGKPSEGLRAATVTPIGSEECIKGFKGFKDVLSKNRNFCVLDSDTSVCSGDSGSGLSYYHKVRKAHVLRGLVSQGQPVCSSGLEAVFTDVVHYLKWIEKNALPPVYNLLGNPTCAGVPKNGRSRDSLPGLVHLKYAFRKSLFISDCHGILITRRHVLTQADCVNKNSFRKLHAVAVGSSAINDYSKPVQQFAIADTHVNNELAIIKLSDDVNESIKPVCIPTRAEEGKLRVLFWKRQSKHPKYVQEMSTIDQNKQMSSIQDMLDVKISDDTDNWRLGSTPLIYTVDDETGGHLYLRALEKCSIKGCSNGQSPAFVDVLKYRKWIKQKAGQYMDNDLVTPPLDFE